MVRNRSHGESYDRRLERFRSGSPIESIETLLNSISNYFNNEIKLAAENRQTVLLFLGIHAAILSIAENIFNKNGLGGYKYFLENFVDGETDDLKFSKIASKIHGWRNIIAHQWLGKMGHSIQYDYNMDLGWREENGAIIINPGVYCRQYINTAFGERIWNYKDYLTERELNEAKERIIKKYIEK